MTPIRLDKITRRFDQTVALDTVDLAIEAGELFFLLGPSGCGKSTLLRIVAGLLEPTAGRIFFGERDVTALGTEKRNAVMCFQSYALWPHLTVEQNVRFGLDVRGTDKAAAKKRVDEVLGLVQMEQYAGRRPNQLSGGQQQRVALARALAVNPDCLLLDEPLSNLDAQLRQEMRSDIRRICKAAGTTTIYVTHDQKEALSIADRLAVMRTGRIAQVGTPAQLYHEPNSPFVAAFIGQTNLLPGKVVERDGEKILVDTPAGRFIALSRNGIPQDVTLSIRPEQFRVVRDGSGAGVINRLTGRTMETTFLGEASEHILLVNGKQPLHVIRTPPMFHVPNELTVEVDPRDVLVLPSDPSGLAT